MAAKRGEKNLWKWICETAEVKFDWDINRNPGSIDGKTSEKEEKGRMKKGQKKKKPKEDKRHFNGTAVKDTESAL